ncbi:uncharacterized protein P174DRAFT_35196 [Aspergillus novofumigatus IBT 16806]|uniref:Uncharacterized protein n=1 Tax=Aspergillus novofumigatus (strain IBT 16806) TaxID=1392255 RepID=A0A2I1CMX7_ASPN1|nr:uncharacterized protein P174DRAFT_35196 [Aspergillus novofumigatus IBT 16806]PKX98987.1 hypothetical protein P174DRAFT_35196 [Aspergillus novofumigatus IBT 16806]
MRRIYGVRSNRYSTPCPPAQCCRVGLHRPRRPPPSIKNITVTIIRRGKKKKERKKKPSHLMGLVCGLNTFMYLTSCRDLCTTTAKAGDPVTSSHT